MGGGVALGLTAAALAGMPAQAIDSTPPTGPGNIEVFPNRDMVAIEGYADQAGKKATITVRRGGQVVGSATGTVDATGFLEVNHPGGVCWGAGTDLKVTPDITANDELRVDFSDGHYDGSKVVDVEATGVVVDEEALTLRIDGRYGPGVDMPGTDLATDPGKFGIEIVNPDMRDATSGIGERAIGWPSDEPAAGYTVAGTVEGTDATGGTFSVTYGFGTLDDLKLADAGSITALGWLADLDPALGEAQLGLSLHEFHEHGGPGMGGCPAGPTEVRTNGPSTYSARGGGAGEVDVQWGAATPTPGAPAVTGYTVRAVDQDGNEKGKRLGADARSATIDGLVPDGVYSVEIAATSAAGEGDPSVVSRVRASEHVAPTATASTARQPNADGKFEPLVRTDTEDFGVHLDPAEGVLGAEVRYTTNGSTPTLSSRTYVPGVSSSIQVRQDTTLRWIVVDSGNVVGPLGQRFFDIVESAAAAPTEVTAVVAQASGAVDVSWPRIEDAAVEAYRVQAYTGASEDVASGIRVGAPVIVTRPGSGEFPARVTATVSGLTNGTPYKFAVAARYGTVWTVDSPLTPAVTPEPAASVQAGPNQTTLRNRTVTLDGSASTKVTTYRWIQVQPADPAATKDPAVVLSGADTAKPTFVFPRKTSPTSDDGTYTFELTTTHPNPDPASTSPITKTDTVDVTEQKDVVVAQRARWRAGDPLRMNGTGSQNGAVLTFHDATARGRVIGTTTVTGGVWTAPAVVTNLSNGSIYVWSDHGFVGNIQTTR